MSNPRAFSFYEEVYSPLTGYPYHTSLSTSWKAAKYAANLFESKGFGTYQQNLKQLEVLFSHCYNFSEEQRFSQNFTLERMTSTFHQYFGLHQDCFCLKLCFGKHSEIPLKSAIEYLQQEAQELDFLFPLTATIPMSVPISQNCSVYEQEVLVELGAEYRYISCEVQEYVQHTSRNGDFPLLKKDTIGNEKEFDDLTKLGVVSTSWMKRLKQTLGSATLHDFVCFLRDKQVVRIAEIGYRNSYGGKLIPVIISCALKN